MGCGLDRRCLSPALAGLIALLLLSIADAGAALAQSVREEGVACKGAKGLQRPETVCAEQAWQKADAELNRV
jgi:uncharacterized protein YecT (DUF1311 family)